MVLKDIIFVCAYSPGANNVGYRRSLFLANSFAEQTEANVYFVTEFEPILVQEYIAKNINFVYSKKRVILADVDHQPAKFVAIKKWTLKFIGQLPDPRFIWFKDFVKSNKHQIFTDLDPNSTVIFASHPPWISFLLGAYIKKKLNFKLLLDFRDLFYKSHLFSSNLAWVERKIQNYLLKRCDFSLSVSKPWCNFIEQRCMFIPNGFDSAKFTNAELSISNKFRYFGTVTNIDRVSLEFLKFVKVNLHIEFEFYGDCKLIEDLLNECDNVRFFGTIDYEKAILLMQTSLFNVLFGFHSADVSRAGMIQTKVYEYMRAYRPIAYFGPINCSTHDIIEKSNLVTKFSEAKVSVIDLDQIVVNSLDDINLPYIEQFDRHYGFLEIAKLLGCELKNDKL